MTSWARRSPSVDVTVECFGASHTVRYRRGSIVLVDHVVTDEVALRSLGGPEPACVGVLRAWRQTTLDTVSTPESIRARMRAHGQVPPWVVSLPPALDAARRTALLANAERAWTRGRAADAGAYLERATKKIAVPELNRWLLVSGEASRQPVAATCHVAAPPGQASAESWHRDVTLHVAVWLPVHWWRTVGLRARALVDGGLGFVLDRQVGSALVARWRYGRLEVAEERLT